MKKLIVLFIVAMLFLMGCEGLELEEGCSDIQINNTEYQENNYTIYAENKGENGYYKLEIGYIERNSNVDITGRHQFKTEKLYAKNGNFVYQFEIEDNFVITKIIVYSLQNENWVETDKKLIAIAS